MIVLILFSVLFGIQNGCFAQSFCLTPSKTPGECKLIDECEPLFEIQNKLMVTEEELTLLRKSICQPVNQRREVDVRTHVCCPSPTPEVACTTPEGIPGRCVNISSCEHLAALISKTASQETRNYLKNSRCYGLNQYSICCGPKPTKAVTLPTTQVIPTANSRTFLENQGCTTPEGLSGKCVNISSCVHLSALLETNIITEDAIGYVMRSRCRGSYLFSVCCGPKPIQGFSINTSHTSTEVAPPEASKADATAESRASSTGDTSHRPKTCAEKVSAFPPDPTSLCCGRDSHMSVKIFGGEVTDIDEHPWLVLIGYSDDAIRTCGGSLISGKYVLTAAHCVYGPQLRGASPSHIMVGEYDRSNEGPDCSLAEGEDCTDGARRIDIEKVIRHPTGQDIALVRLKEMAPYTDFIRPVCLPSTDVTVLQPEGLKLIVAGWGATENTTRSNIKMEVELPFVNETECQASLVSRWRIICAGIEHTPKCELTYQKIIQKHVLCAGGVKGKDSCSGDSGGPLMYENGTTYQIIGVLSVGSTPCAQENRPALYMKVLDYMDWIRDSIQP